MAARSEAEIIKWAQENPVYQLLLENGLSPRELEEVRFACHYASEFLHGTDGHSRLLIIAKITQGIFEISETIGLHGHMLRCPDCNLQLTSLLLCTKCGKRFELVEQGTRAALEWASQNMASAYDDIISHMNNADALPVITWDYDRKDESHSATIDVQGRQFKATIKRYLLDYRWWLHGCADGHASSVNEARRKVEDAINEAINLR